VSVPLFIRFSDPHLRFHPMKTFLPSRFWTLATVLLLAAALPLHAGNRYDERKVDSKYETRGDDDTEPVREEPAAESESVAKSEEEASASEPAAPAEAAPAAEATPEPQEPLPPLPPAAQFAVSLGLELAEGTRAPKEPVAEFEVGPTSLFASVTMAGEGPQGLSGRIIAEQVEGVPAGEEICRAACDEEIGEQRTVALQFPLPGAALAAGRYRLEVQENHPAHRTITTVLFATKLPPLPAAARIKVGLHAVGSSPEELSCGEVPAEPEPLAVSVEPLDTVNVNAAANIVVEEVPGLPAGRVLAGTQAGNPLGLRSGGVRATLDLELPRLGLPAGRYRLEVREALPPARVIKSVVFTTHAAAATEAFDLADPENGGLLEAATGEDGAGLTWAWTTLRPSNRKIWESSESGAPATLPCELVLSFYKRELAMVAAVELFPGDGVAAPQKVEIWGSMVSPKDGFQKLAERELPPPEDLAPAKIPVPGSLMRYVKIRFLSAQGGADRCGLRAVRVLEAKADGYQPLAQRCPDVRDWKLQPRHAAQQGLFFLQARGAQFQRENNCMGCHVQSQALMGLSIARKNDYVVSAAAERALADFTTACGTSEGFIRRHTDESDVPDRTNTIFGALGLAYAHPNAGSAAALQTAARWLATEQDPEGVVLPDSVHDPVTQGAILQTAHAMQIWAVALAEGGSPSLQQNITRALAWVVAEPAATTQDKVFKILACQRHGGPTEKKLARQLCQELLGEQGKEGAWRVDPAEPGGVDSPFATGQVLYALRQAGYSPNTPSFRRGVQWLIAEQSSDAFWRAGDTQSPFASTMWPVIALTGSFSNKGEPAKISVTALPRPVPPLPPPPAPVVAVAKATLPKNILLVFDCSFSMTDKIRGRAKFEIAKEVLREVIGKLPDDTKVGLRLYGHRHGSMTGESRTDTELAVPVGPLNRAKLIGVIDAAKTQGQTPLVLSTQKAAEDLKKVGGGIVVVVTDGEESCGGRPRKVGPELAALGIPLRVEVIGFALTGRRVVDEMNAFTAPTGGRFHTAADGVQLAAALKEATAPVPVAAPPPPPPPSAPEPEDLPYEVFDAQGLSVAKGSTLGEAPELAPGEYSVELRDGAKTAKLEKLKLAEGQTLELRYDPASGVLDRVL
jgi:hypothetical protein